MKCLSIKQGVEKEKDKAAMNSVKKRGLCWAIL